MPTRLFCRGGGHGAIAGDRTRSRSARARHGRTRSALPTKHAVVLFCNHGLNIMLYNMFQHADHHRRTMIFLNTRECRRGRRTREQHTKGTRFGPALLPPANCSCCPSCSIFFAQLIADHFPELFPELFARA